MQVLKSLGVSFSVALPTMLYLETEEEQAELAMFLLDNRERRISEGEIIAKVSEILNKWDAIRAEEEIE